ncbi:MAG: hypothetical protein ACI8RD_009919 [Bacillariaceae sp.]
MTPYRKPKENPPLPGKLCVNKVLSFNQYTLMSSAPNLPSPSYDEEEEGMNQKNKTEKSTTNWDEYRGYTYCNDEEGRQTILSIITF